VVDLVPDFPPVVDLSLLLLSEVLVILLFLTNVPGPIATGQELNADIYAGFPEPKQL